MHATLLSIFFITIFYSFSAFGWQNAHQEFTPAQLEFLALTEYPVTFMNKIFSKNQKKFIRNLHINGNLIRVVSRCFDLDFKKNEVEQIYVKLLSFIQNQDLVSKQIYTLKYFRMIEKYRFKLKDRRFVEELCHSILISDANGKTMLMLAIETGDNDIFDLFLEYYLKENCPINARDYRKRTALCKALEIGTLHMVEKLYDIPGIEVENINNYGSTDLMVATKNLQPEVFDFVVQKYCHDKRDLKIKRHKDGKDALDLAQRNHNQYALDALLNANFQSLKVNSDN
ncbi:ankyrin repeat domain-containing protein [Candidatus Dependentiae bacterium]|jgi:hypothetical protein|nr:ankyrin repeat domain-containing protein [Candidatus Dependentiae bacterium]